MVVVCQWKSSLVRSVECVVAVAVADVVLGLVVVFVSVVVVAVVVVVVVVVTVNDKGVPCFAFAFPPWGQHAIYIYIYRGKIDRFQQRLVVGCQ